jgi:hypothetical protein
MKEVTMYMLDNGDMYNTQEEAQQAELFLEMVNLIEKDLDGDSSEDFAKFMLRNREKILHFLNNCKEAYGH